LRDFFLIPGIGPADIAFTELEVGFDLGDEDPEGQGRVRQKCHLIFGAERQIVSFVLKSFTNQFLRLAKTVHRGGINQVDSAVNRCADRAVRVIPLGTTPYPPPNRQPPKPAIELQFRIFLKADIS
jgi:hypothetical protein